TRWATGATCSEDDGWPTRSAIFGLFSAEFSCAAPTLAVDGFTKPAMLVTTDLPHRIAAPTRTSTTPTAIALLNGNTAPVRARFFCSPPAGARGRAGGWYRSASSTDSS